MQKNNQFLLLILAALAVFALGAKDVRAASYQCSLNTTIYTDPASCASGCVKPINPNGSGGCSSAAACSVRGLTGSGNKINVQWTDGSLGQHTDSITVPGCTFSGSAGSPNPALSMGRGIYGSGNQFCLNWTDGSLGQHVGCLSVSGCTFSGSAGGFTPATYAARGLYADGNYISLWWTDGSTSSGANKGNVTGNISGTCSEVANTTSCNIYWTPTASTTVNGQSTLTWTTTDADSATYTCTGPNPVPNPVSGSVVFGQTVMTFPSAGTETCTMTVKNSTNNNSNTCITSPSLTVGASSTCGGVPQANSDPCTSVQTSGNWTLQGICLGLQPTTPSCARRCKTGYTYDSGTCVNASSFLTVDSALLPGGVPRGSGTVTSSDGKINCHIDNVTRTETGTCTFSANNVPTMYLTATPDPGSSLYTDCTGINDVGCSYFGWWYYGSQASQNPWDDCSSVIDLGGGTSRCTKNAGFANVTIYAAFTAAPTSNGWRCTDPTNNVCSQCTVGVDVGCVNQTQATCQGACHNVVGPQPAAEPINVTATCTAANDNVTIAWQRGDSQTYLYYWVRLDDQDLSSASHNNSSFESCAVGCGSILTTGHCCVEIHVNTGGSVTIPVISGHNYTAYVRSINSDYDDSGPTYSTPSPFKCTVCTPNYSYTCIPPDTSICTEAMAGQLVNATCMKADTNNCGEAATPVTPSTICGTDCKAVPCPGSCRTDLP